MPTECERSEASPAATTSGAATTSAAAITTTQQQPLSTANIEQKDLHDMEMNSEMTTSTGSTSSSSTANGHNGSTSNGGKKTSITSPDPTAYVAKARVTRPTPPPPSYNPMQFVQIKPCNLYQTAQQQLKKAEEVKKIKEIKKEEPEDWQNNLDNWKSSRRKRVEHIIDRVVEVKKLELEEHDRSRRKSKTFSEMIEERGERGVRGGRAKLVSLAVYNEDESNDLSDLGIGTSSASGKSSLSEDYDNNSVMSDNADLDRAIFEHNHQHPPGATTREYISSPGYDTSSSTAPASSPDPCEYTYEGAIQDYKQRVSRATSGGSAGFKLNTNGAGATNGVPTSKEPTPERSNNGSADVYPTRRGSKIEERLIGFEVFSPNDSQEAEQRSKVDVPKIDISKRKEIFESTNSEPKSQATTSNGVPKVALRDRFQPTATEETNAKKEMKRLSGDITSSIKDRLQSLEQQQNLVNSSSSSSSGGGAKNSSSSSAMVVDVPVPPLKERLSSLQNAVTKEEVKKPPVVLVDARQLEIMKDEEENAKLRRKQEETTTTTTTTTILPMELSKETKNATTQPLEVESQMESEVDRDDSGIHVEEERLLEQQQQQLLLQAQEQQLNEAIAALVNEEKQLEEAANAVNQIEAEFAGLALDGSGSGNGSTSATTTTTNEHPCEMEFSINEALELALEAIDKETTTSTSTSTTTTTTATATTLTATKIPTTTTFTSISTSATSTSTKSTSTTITHGNKTSNHNNNNNNNKYDAADSIDQLLIMENPTPDDKSSAPTQDEPQDGDDAEVERKIQNEPIYENIASTTHADTESEVIPSNNTNIKQTYKSQDQSQDNNIPNIESFPVAPETLPKSVDSLAHEQHQQGSVAPFEPTGAEDEPYYQVPKSSEPYYDAPKHLRPVPVYENIEVFYSGLENSTLAASIGSNAFQMEPPKEKPPPPPTDSPPSFDDDDDDAIVDGADPVEPWTTTTTTDNTYETISNRLPNGVDGSDPHPSPPIKRMNSTKRIKKELRHKRSSFLGLEGSADDDLESYLELTVAPPPDMAQLLQEERRLEKQLYLKAGLCDSSDTGESRDSGVSENHSRQSSEPFTNSSEEADRPSDDAPLSLNTTVSTGLKQEEFFYQNELPPGQTQTLLQTVKGNSAESWTESATEAAAATQSLTEATATANAKMLSIEEKIREQEEVLRVERELLQLEQEELKRQRENLILRENLARRELQHGAKMLMSANRHSMQDLNGGGGGGGGGVVAGFENPSMMPAPQQQQPQQIYANVPNLPHQQYYQVETDYRKSMSDLNEFSKRLMLAPGGGGVGAPLPPTKPMRSMHVSTTNGHDEANFARQRHSLNAQGYGGSLVKIAGSSTGPGLGPAPSAAAPQRQSTGAIYTNYQLHQSAQNLANVSNGHVNNPNVNGSNGHLVHAPNAHLHSNMTRNTLHALSATPKPKYTDGWVQVQNRKSFDSNLANDPAWLSAYQQKRKSVPDAYHYNNNNNHWLVQEAEQRRLAEQHQLRSVSATNTPSHQPAGGVAKGAASSGNGKPLPDSIIQTLTERVQSKGIGERKRFDNYNNVEKSPLHAAASYQHHSHPQQQQQTMILSHPAAAGNGPSTRHALDLAPLGHMIAPPVNGSQDKVLSVSGKKKCSHCGDELGRGAAMIIESLLLFYHINCFKCCVCHVQLGDGLNGTDVRVRNHKLHCQNCYSSDDGIKFSCV